MFSRNKRGLLYDAATGKSNVAGGYATGMVNTITNSPTGWAWDMLTKSGLISSPTQLQNQLKLLQSGAVSVSEQQKVIVEITADAQQMGIGVAKSPAITSAMQGVVQQFAQ